MLSKKAVAEFKELYKKQYGEELNDFVATEAANRLLRLVDIVYRPITKEEYKQIEQKQEAAPKGKKVDLVKHLVSDAKVSELKAELGEKKFWELVRKSNAAKGKAKNSEPKQNRKR